MTKGSTELSAAATHCSARMRGAGSTGISLPARSAMRSTIAPEFEDRNLVVPVSRHLAERLEAAMFGGLRIGDQVDLVGLADFLEGPAWAHVADKAAGELRNPAEGGDGWNHFTLPVAVSKERI